MSNKFENKNALRIAAYFAGIGLFWIYCSDYLVELLLKDVHNYRWIQSVKGSLFVITVSCIIYFLVRRLLLKIKSNNQDVISSEKRLRNTLDNLIEGCQIIDFDWRYVYLNNVAAEHGKKAEDELLGKMITETYPGIEKTEMFGHLRNCMEKRIPHKMQNRFEYSDGSHAWFELSIEPIPEGIFVLSYNITKRKETQLALQKSTERLVEAQRIAKLGDFKWDYGSGKITWSEALYELLGYDKSECINYGFVNKNIHHPEDLGRITEWLQNTVLSENNILDPLEYRIFKKDKSIIYVRTSGIVDYSKPHSPIIFATVQDITQIQNYIQEIEKKNEFIQTVLDNLPIGIALNKLNEGQCTYMNKKFVEIYGWSEEELTSVKDFFQRVYPDKEYRELIIKQVSDDINSGDPSRMHWENITITQQSGEQRIINAVNIPLFDQNTMVSTVMDITELKNYQEKIILAMEKAQESDRLKSAFLANMSHEIRTPLNGIMGFSEIMLNSDELTKDAKKRYAGIIKSCSNGLLQIVNDILDISALESGNFHLNTRHFELNQLMEKLLNIFNAKLRENASECKLILVNKNNDLILNNDEDRLQQIFINLLDNAIKFTEKGEIVFGIDRVEKKSITFFVKDSGVGIPKKYHELIFDRFRQAEKSKNKAYGGNGLGLSIIKELLKLMHGKIWLESEANIGTTFYFEIPFDENIKIHKTRNLSESSLFKSKRKLKILIVDDYQINTLFLREILKEIESEIMDTDMGSEAIKIAKENNFDIILMDICLPDISGLEVVKEIRKFNKTVFVIAQTAYAMEADEKKAISAGCDAYISKPIKKEVLYEKLLLANI